MSSPIHRKTASNFSYFSDIEDNSIMQLIRKSSKRGSQNRKMTHAEAAHEITLIVEKYMKTDPHYAKSECELIRVRYFDQYRLAS
ncbi:hypothetical protein HC928_02705 [bacterium]|nr:hypothetical protein [bacterium]